MNLIAYACFALGCKFECERVIFLNTKQSFLYVVKFFLVSLIICAACLLFWLCSARLCGESNEEAAVIDTDPFIIIDAGHGGRDGGAVGVKGTLEKDLNLAVALQMRDLAAVLGVPVLLTRESDVALSVEGDSLKKLSDLKRRVQIADEHPEAIFLSIHMNSYVGAQCRGMQVFYSQNDAKSKAFADGIQSYCALVLGPQNDRTPKRAGSNIYLLDRITSPAVLVECGFISDATDEALLCDVGYQKNLALAVLGAVCSVADGENT